jgi:O-antigen ligase
MDEEAPVRLRAAGAGEALLGAALLLAPWPYGSAPDWARYALAGAALLASALGLLGAGRLPAVALPLGALLAWGLLQAVLGISVAPVSTVEASLLVAAFGGTVVFASAQARSHRAALRLAALVLAAVGLQAAYGAYAAAGGPRVYGQASETTTMPFGSYVNHNHFAGLVGMGAVLALSLALGHARRSRNLTPRAIAYGGLALAFVAAHLASRSRGGLLALAAGLVVLAALWARGRGKRLALGLAAAAALVAFGVAAVPAKSRARLATLLEGTSDPSARYRIDVFAYTLRLAASRPLTGSGLGAYADAVPAVKRAHGEVRVTHAESDALEFLAEGGLVGAAILAWLASVAVGGLRDRLAHGHDPLRQALAMGAAAAVATLLFHSLVDFNLRLPANALVFSVLLGLAASPREAEAGVGGRLSCAVVSVCLAAAAATAAWRAQGAWMLDRALDRRPPEVRVAALDRALRWHPYLAEGHRARGVGLRAVAAGDPRRLARAEADLSRAVRLRPAWGEAWAELAWTRLLGSDRDGARSAMSRAVAMDPTHVAIRKSEAAFTEALGARK